MALRSDPEEFIMIGSKFYREAEGGERGRGRKFNPIHRPKKPIKAEA